jgi:uncharacterized protein (TIGR01777 family)
MPDRKRIVITGATGLIGTRLVEHLAGRGDSVAVLARDPERARRVAPGAADYFEWSGSMTDGGWTSSIDGADAVINLAGSSVSTRWTSEQRKRIRGSRIDGTRHLVAAMERSARPPRTLISASGVGYYGTSKTKTFTEDSPAGSDFLATTCIDWEGEAIRAEGLGVRVVLLRTGIVLEPNGGALGKLLPTFRAFAGGPMGSGKQWFPWIHIEDELGLLIWALDNEEVSGPVNAVAPGIVTNGEFSETLGRVLGRPTFFAVPKFVLDLVFGEASLILVKGQRAIPERAEALGYWFRFPKLENALRNLLPEG